MMKNILKKLKKLVLNIKVGSLIKKQEILIKCKNILDSPKKVLIFDN